MFDLLIVGVRWPPETFIRRKIEKLVESGVQVTIAAKTPGSLSRFHLQGVELLRLPHWDDPLITRGLRLGWHVLRLLITTGGRSRLAKLWNATASLPLRARPNHLLESLILATRSPDVVHFEWNTAAISFWHITSIWNCPVVISCRGSQINVRPHVPGNKQLVGGLHKTFAEAAAVHCVSEDIKREAMQYGLTEEKAWIVRPAVDPEFFAPSAVQGSRERLRLVSTGSLIWRKGYEYALSAMRCLVDAGLDFEYVIIGEGKEKHRILFTIDDLGLHDVARLAGKLSPEEVRDTLQQSDIFVLSSLSEGISNAALEAMAGGLPVVTTDCGGMREAITDGIEGFVVPVRDSAAMAEAVMKLARNPTLRATMGAAGRERILREFTLTQQTEKFLEMYRSISCRDHSGESH